jgi:hypothetical protein
MLDNEVSALFSEQIQAFFTSQQIQLAFHSDLG